MTVIHPAQKPEHPLWCLRDACDIEAGGMHVSRSRVVTEDRDDSVLFFLDLAQARTGGVRVRVRREPGGPVAQLTLAAAGAMARALKDLGFAAKRAQQ